MKKEPIIYFPQDPEIPMKREAQVGRLLRIGKPSKRYYEHIYHSMNHNAHRLEDLQRLLKVEGFTVRIISILRMRTGDKIAVLHRKDGKDFLTDIKKLFANIDKALDTNELKFQ